MGLKPCECFFCSFVQVKVPYEGYRKISKFRAFGSKRTHCPILNNQFLCFVIMGLGFLNEIHSLRQGKHRPVGAGPTL